MMQAENNKLNKGEIPLNKVAVILGSPTKSSRLNGVVAKSILDLEQKGIEVDLIPVYNLPAEDLLFANFNSPAVKEANKLVEEADALIIATPVYKGAYSGILKAYLDLLPQKALEDKIILPLAMGGTTAHLLMLEYALKPVLSVLGVTHMEHGVFVKDSTVIWNERGTVDIEQATHERLTIALSQLCKRLSKQVLV